MRSVDKSKKLLGPARMSAGSCLTAKERAENSELVHKGRISEKPAYREFDFTKSLRKRNSTIEKAGPEQKIEFTRI